MNLIIAGVPATLPLIFSHVWLPGKVVCQESASGTEESPGKELIQNETVRQAWPVKKRSQLSGEKLALTLLVLHPFPSTAPFKYTHIRVLETEQKQRELFF